MTSSQPSKQKTDPQTYEVINVPVKDIAYGIFQSRRSKNPRMDEIQKSLVTYGQRDPIRISVSTEDIERRTGKKYFVSVSGNTRMEIAENLGWATIKAIIVPAAAQVCLMAQALDENYARGGVDFSDNAQFIYNTFQLWEQNSTSGIGNIARFTQECAPCFAKSYVYIAVPVGGLFALSKSGQIPLISKSIAEEIMKYTGIMKKTLKNFDFSKKESDAFLASWANALAKNLNAAHPNNLIREQARDFLSKKKGLLVAQATKHLLCGHNAQNIVAEMLDKDILNAIDCVQGVKNPNHYSDLSRLAEGVQNEQITVPQRGGSTSFTFTFNKDIPTFHPETGKVSAESVELSDQKAAWVDMQLCGGLYYLGKCATDNKRGFLPQVAAAIKVWKILLPGLFDIKPEEKSTFSKKLAFDCLHQSSQLVNFNERGIDNFRVIQMLDKKSTHLKQALISIGIAADKLSKEDLALMISLIGMHCPEYRMYKGHAYAFTAPYIFSVNVIGESYSSRKFIGVFPWPILKKNSDPQKSSFFGTPDLTKGIGFVAGILDCDKPNSFFKFPTKNKKIFGVPDVRTAVCNAICALKDSGLSVNIGDGAENELSSELFSDLIDAGINGVSGCSSELHQFQQRIWRLQRKVT